MVLLSKNKDFCDFHCTNVSAQSRKQISVGFFLVRTLSLCPEGAENMCLGSQVPDLMFLKAELYKESKNGFKTINFRPPSVMIFSKNCFWSKKIIKKVGRFADF